MNYTIVYADSDTGEILREITGTGEEGEVIYCEHLSFGGYNPVADEDDTSAWQFTLSEDDFVFYVYYTAIGDHEHELEFVETIAPTCTEPGYDLYKCIICNEEFRSNFSDPLGHVYDVPHFEWAEDYSSCVAAFTCSRCGEEVSMVCSIVITRTNETCTQDGVYTYTASITFEGIEYNNVRTRVVSATGHSWYVSRIVEPTCTSSGYTEHTCERCGATYNDDYTDALGHNYIETKQVEVTCTEEGYTEYTCIRCNNIMKANVIPALGHDYVDTVIDPTCTTRGYTEHECQRCGYIYDSDDTAPLGHDFVYTRTIEPTVFEDGYDIYTCTRCGEEWEDAIDKVQIYVGTAVKVAECDLYALPTSTDSEAVITGTYYIWDDTVVNDRVKITNSLEYCEVTQLVTGWISIYDIGRTIVETGSGIKYGLGDVIDARSLNVYESYTKNTLVAIKNCKLYVANTEIRNERIQVVEEEKYVGVDDALILGYVKLSDI